MTNKNDALPVVAWETYAPSKQIGLMVKDVNGIWVNIREVNAVLSHRDAELAELRAEVNRYADMLDDTSKAYGAELARIEGERDQLQAELAALRELLGKCLVAFDNCTGMKDQKVRVNWYAEHLVPTADAVRAALSGNAAPLVSDKAGAVIEREEYEKHRRAKDGIQDRHLVIYPTSGTYKHQEVQVAWEAWQARAAINPLAADVAQPEPLAMLDLRVEALNASPWAEHADRTGAFVKGALWHAMRAADVAQGGEVERLQVELAAKSEAFDFAREMLRGERDRCATQTARADASERLLKSCESLILKMARRLEEEDAWGDYDSELERAYTLIGELIKFERAQPEVAQNTGSNDMANKPPSHGHAVTAAADGAATPDEAADGYDIFAWATFDGEGGYDLRLYEGNEEYREEWNRQGRRYESWVEPLYRKAAPVPTEQKAQPVAADVVQVPRELMQSYIRALDKLDSEGDAEAMNYAAHTADTIEAELRALLATSQSGESK